jgi:hypothetical protein
VSTAFAVGLSPAPLVTFPAPSLKFRTLSFPQSGFKPRRPSISACPSRKTAELKRRVRMRSLAVRFDIAFVACVPSCGIGRHSQPARLGPFQQPPRPTGPLLRKGSVVPFLLATTTRSASLDRSPCLPKFIGYAGGLCPTTWYGLPPRPSLLWVSAPSTRAITSTPGGKAGPTFPDPSPCFHGLPH